MSNGRDPRADLLAVRRDPRADLEDIRKKSWWRRDAPIDEGVVRGLAQSELSTVRGVAELGAAGRGAATRAFLPPGIGSLVSGLMPKAASAIQGLQQDVEAGVPEGGEWGYTGGRMAGDIAQMVMGGSAVRGMGYGLKTAGIVGSAPIATVQGFGGKESSVSPFLAELLDSDTLRDISENPIKRALFEGGLDILLGGVAEGVISGVKYLRRAKPAAETTTRGFGRLSEVEAEVRARPQEVSLPEPKPPETRFPEQPPIDESVRTTDDLSDDVMLGRMEEFPEPQRTKPAQRSEWKKKTDPKLAEFYQDQWGTIRRYRDRAADIKVDTRADLSEGFSMKEGADGGWGTWTGTTEDSRHMQHVVERAQDLIPKIEVELKHRGWTDTEIQSLAERANRGAAPVDTKLYTGLDPALVRELGPSAIGGAIGAGVGGAIGAQDDKTLAGTAIGALIGAGFPLLGARRTLLKGAKPAVAGFEPRPLKTEIYNFLKRNLTTAGHLPRAVHERLLQLRANLTGFQREAAYRQRDFGRAMKKSYGTTRFDELPPAEVQKINDVLHGKLRGAHLPPEMRAVVDQMRTDIDKLSVEMMNSGLIEGPLMGTFMENLGVYVHRSYRAFDDPNWAQIVRREHPELINRAQAWLRRENPNLSNREVDDLIKAFLEPDDIKADTPLTVMARAGQKAGIKNLSILRRRQDIAPELRALWGEHKNPLVNYMRSVVKMSHLLENHKFLTDVRRAGKGGFFFDKPTTQNGVEYVRQFASEGNKALEPLDGLYTTPEITQAFRDAMESPQVGYWMREYYKLNVAVKGGKTILSPITMVRNLLANQSFMLANMHIGGFRHIPQAVRVISANATGGPGKWRNAYLKYVRLKVVQSDTRSGELFELLRMSAKSDYEFESNATLKLLKTVGGWARTAYTAGDDFWKILAFESEVARYARAMPNTPIGEIEQMAAEIVINTFPTYSMIPRAVQKLRRVALVGNFVSFPSEVIRTGYKTLELASKELRSGNSAIRAIGAQRLVGMTMAVTGAGVVAAGTRYLTGRGKDEEDDLRGFMAPWSENSDFLHLGKEGTTYRLADLSYTDVYSYLRNPVKALMRGEDWKAALWDATTEFFDPFFSEEILFGTLADISRNQTREGMRIWNPQDDWVTQHLDKVEHLWSNIEPGFMSQGRRIVKGAQGYVSPTGRAYDVGEEIRAVVTGLRVSSVDIPQSFRFKAGRYAREKSESHQIFTSSYNRGGTVSDREILDDYRRSEKSKQKLFDEMREDIMRAQRLGMSEAEVREALESALSKSDAQALIRGVYEPYRPTPRAGQRLDPRIRAERQRLIQGVGR